MKKYDSYKDSGIEWIGEIPNHWNISRYRYFYFSNMGVTLLKEDVKEDGIYPVYSATETDVLFGYVDEASVILNEGDIVIPARGNSIGHIKVVTSPSTSTQTTIYSKKISQNIETNFVKYFLQGLREHLFQFDRTAIPQITVNQVKNNPLVIPPPEEQIAIAHYLDRKTAEIDELIADKKRLLELYEEEKNAIINQAVTKGINPNVPMKDSGIEWLGEIPEHWEVKRLKMVVSKIGSGVTPSGGSTVYLTSGIPLLRSQNIHFGGLRLDDVAFISDEIDEGMSNSRIQDGDVLLNITGASIGRCYYVPHGFGKGNVNQHVCIIRPISEKIDTIFLYYILRSEIGQTQIRLQQTGANREGLNFEQLKNFGFPIPESIQEQQSIVRHMETECTRIDAKKAKTEKLIELLTEYRTALISEVVTGKIKVID